MGLTKGNPLRFLASLLTGLLIQTAAGPVAAVDGVARWTELADSYGEGLANWRTQAIMHRAMHDAMNAALPTFKRWIPPAKDEPSAAGASADVAMAAAAAQVLNMLHPSRRETTELALEAALAHLRSSPSGQTGFRLGGAIGKAAVEQRDDDGGADIRPFRSSTGPGRWSETPEEYGGSNTTSTLPFLSLTSEAASAPPPPALDGDDYRADVDEVRRLGRSDSGERTFAQSQAAIFWASQSSQRGFLHLAIRLLDEHPRIGGAIEHVRVLSQLASALADSAILSWREKEHFSFWRPVTAIRAGSPGVEADPHWSPLLETPPFPEYPSGHAADCYTGSALLKAVLGKDVQSITYVSLAGSDAALDTLPVGMGQHGQANAKVEGVARRFASLDAAAEECAESRIWAGAHFRASLDEARRLGGAIAARAESAVPGLGHQMAHQASPKPDR